jgi:predicted LPLAT superfamily acyltransferase
LLASVLKAPVMLAFGLYRGGNRYDLCFEPFDARVDIPRAQRADVLTALIQRYVDRLEHHLHGAPYNWFNFYDFWQTETPSPPARPAAGEPGDTGAGQRG